MEKIEENAVVRRDYKDTLFRMIFREKSSLLSLYNAVNGTDYTDPEELEIVTLENAIYMNMKNDLAFVIDFYLNLYEHQSTFSPNMPLRNLFYIARELQNQVETNQLYRTKLVKIPTPRFLVFYNGTKEQPAQQVLRLSDAFLQPTAEPELELVVTMLNINMNKNQEVLEKCRLLKEYMQYIEKVRRYASCMEPKEAVERAVTEAIKEGILKEFLTKYRNEAIAVSIFEYNEELALSYIREDEYQKGHEDGRLEGEKLGRIEGEKFGRLEGEKIGRIEGEKLGRIEGEKFGRIEGEKFGRIQGEAVGIEKGEAIKLIQQVCKKMKKGKPAEIIAEELEEKPSVVEGIYQIAEEYGDDCDKIYERLKEQEK